MLIVVTRPGLVARVCQRHAKKATNEHRNTTETQRTEGRGISSRKAQCGRWLLLFEDEFMFFILKFHFPHQGGVAVLLFVLAKVIVMPSAHAPNQKRQ